MVLRVKRSRNKKSFGYQQDSDYIEGVIAGLEKTVVSKFKMFAKKPKNS